MSLKSLASIFAAGVRKWYDLFMNLASGGEMDTAKGSPALLCIFPVGEGTCGKEAAERYVLCEDHLVQCEMAGVGRHTFRVGTFSEDSFSQEELKDV